MPPTADPAAAPSRAPAEPRTVVWRYLRALGASAAEADDLAQETMLAALRRAEAPAQALLLGIAKHQWLRSRRFWQRRREREVAAAVDELWQRSAADGGDELLDRLRECLARLQPRAREALELHYRDGLAWPEVAARVGLLPNGIKTLAQRSRQALRTCIERLP